MAWLPLRLRLSYLKLIEYSSTLAAHSLNINITFISSGYIMFEGLFFSVFPMDVRVDMLVSNIWAIEEARMVQ